MWYDTPLTLAAIVLMFFGIVLSFVNRHTRSRNDSTSSWRRLVRHPAVVFRAGFALLAFSNLIRISAHLDSTGNSIGLIVFVAILLIFAALNVLVKSREERKAKRLNKMSYFNAACFTLVAMIPLGYLIA